MITIQLPNGVYYYDQSRPLGRRGGFGQVYFGKTSDGADIAVKKLHLTSAELAHRELRIAEELLGRSFQHVIEFLDSGEDAQSGGYFVIMPKAEKSLQSLIEAQGPLSDAEAARVLFQINQGLKEVGELVHRDLKPDNILLHEGNWKVADFGIARFIEDATSADTLRECMSPLYAAPEQWRSERATHATDTYALGCIGFFLLTGKPPFTEDPAQQHQQAPVPAFVCEDQRLCGLLNIMLRKRPETRPVMSRVSDVLTGILEKPNSPSSSDSLSRLAAAGADVASKEQLEQAAARAEEMARLNRSSVAKAGIEILTGNLERFWGKVHANVPSANRDYGRPRYRDDDFKRFVCFLGTASLVVEWPADLSNLKEKPLPRSGWEVVLAIEMVVAQLSFLPWRAILFYGRPKASAGYRWYEAYFVQRGAGEKRDVGPFINPTVEEMDGALVAGPVSVIIPSAKRWVGVAYGPIEIDDEKETAFHDRWFWVLERAVKLELGVPANIPFAWPPKILR